jgi:hypothetical protein
MPTTNTLYNPIAYIPVANCLPDVKCARLPQHMPCLGDLTASITRLPRVSYHPECQTRCTCIKYLIDQRRHAGEMPADCTARTPRTP